ncbi:ABC transporter permease [Sulfurospirillum sp. 1612]|uniref:ABC transporter permease n=1 Tax=Sulfurospirillum sp. 1612 TaxID=3094835 RepID=UPI002F95DC9B
MIKDKSFVLIFLFLSSIIVLFLTIPLIKLFINVGLFGVIDTLKDAEVYNAIFLTIKAALYSVAFVCVTGIPLAYLIARHEFFGKSVLESIIDIPVMVPHTAAGIALLIAFDNGYIGEALSYLGLGFIDTTTGIVSAMMFLSAPFLINSAKEGFKKVDVEYEYVARTLGASHFSTFFRIVLPNSRNDIINGALMMWSRGLGEFGAVVIIAYHPMVAPVLIFDRFNSFGLKYSAPVAAAMIMVSICLFLAVRFVNNRLK